MKASSAAWLFVGPALLVIAVFFVVPVAAALLMSVTDFDIYGLADLRNVRFIGLDNYLHLLQRPLFWRALLNTLFFVLLGVPLSIAVSLAAAVLGVASLTAFVGAIWAYLPNVLAAVLIFLVASAIAGAVVALVKRTIEVCLGDERIGVLHHNMDGARESAAFAYDEDWRTAADAFPIDPTLPQPTIPRVLLVISTPMKRFFSHFPA